MADNVRQTPITVTPLRSNGNCSSSSSILCVFSKPVNNARLHVLVHLSKKCSIIAHTFSFTYLLNALDTSRNLASFYQIVILPTTLLYAISYIVKSSKIIGPRNFEANSLIHHMRKKLK
uniref:Uncharacterized protein n=1 Tax=Glossina pallidipes TaxID=7398 RepID=A0A1A9ZQ49_GLOPL